MKIATGPDDYEGEPVLPRKGNDMSNGAALKGRTFWQIIAGFAVAFALVTGTISIGGAGNKKELRIQAACIVDLQKVDVRRDTEMLGVREAVSSLQVDMKEVLRRLPQ